MIVKYFVEPISEVAFNDASEVLETIIIDGADISFEVDDKSFLKTIIVSFSGLPMKWERKDLIDQTYPEIRDQAFRVIKYLVDRIQIQVKHRSFDLRGFNHTRVQTVPETEEEKVSWKNCRKRVTCTLNQPCALLGAINIQDYEGKYIHAQAFSNFTDALNVDTPTTAFESFYKVVESFFSSRGSKLDMEVATFMQPYDAKFTPKVFENLRILRNRCMHPGHKKGHIASNELYFCNNLTAPIKSIKEIAELLLKHK